MNVFFDDKSIASFWNEKYMVCPNCGKFAVSIQEDGKLKSHFSCFHCGNTNSHNAKLWLESKVKGHRLYAYNLEHLSYIEGFIDSKLRTNVLTERGYSSHAIGNRLPDWFKKSERRDTVLKSISRMKESVKESDLQLYNLMK